MLFRYANEMMLALCLLIVIGLTSLFSAPFKLLHLQAYDQFLQWRSQILFSSGAQISQLIDPSIIHVDITDQDMIAMQDFDQSLVDLLGLLVESDVRMVLLDIVPGQGLSSNQHFREVLSSSGNIYLPIVPLANKQSVEDPRLLLTMPNDLVEGVMRDAFLYRGDSSIYHAAEGIGHITVNPDEDGVYRRIPLWLDTPLGRMPALSLRLLLDRLSVDLEEVRFVDNELRLGDQDGLSIPVNSDGEMWLNTLNHWGQVYPHIRMGELLAKGDDQLLNLLDNAIVIISDASTFGGDLGPTSFDAYAPLGSLHAHAINTVLSGNHIRHVGEHMVMILVVVIAVILRVISRTLPINCFLMTSLVFAGISFLSIYMLFDMTGFFVEPVTTLVFFVFAIPMLLTVKVWQREVSLTQIRAEQDRVQNELDLARDIQQGFLPRADDSLPIGALNQPAHEVSGDFYDYFVEDNNRLYFCIGDVAGKGVNAALLASRVVSQFRMLGKDGLSPAELLERINEDVCDISTQGRFVTMIAGVLHMDSKKLQFANAGHQPLMLVEEAGEYRLINAQSPPVGILSGMSYQNEVTDVTGICVYAVTDGVTELEFKPGEQLGEDGFLSLVKNIGKLSIRRQMKEIEGFLFSVGDEPKDDVTFMIIDGNNPKS